MLNRFAAVIVVAGTLAVAGCSLSWEGPPDDGGLDNGTDGDGEVAPDAEDGAIEADDASADDRGPDAAEDAPADDGTGDGADETDDGADAADDAGDGARSCLSPGDCNDDNPCTNDICFMEVCTYAWVSDGNPCSDDLFCNGGDRCASGVCEHLGNPCTVPADCDETSDWCGCDDGNACTTGDHFTGTTCAGTNADDLVCGGGCDSTRCSHCCGGTCVNVTENGRCGHCGYSCTSPPESCVYSAGHACGWTWCCGT